MCGALLISVTDQAPGRVLCLGCASSLLEDALASGCFQRLNSVSEGKKG